ncbi:hypothetical protein AB0I28_19675 [Phytomonospora sp. NPDC050363]|uniref:hypothetical protein n=1 Tax=Phytomonospora sp. NPDC050363 TaxID=3155642 RepID=UPI003406CA95
MKLPPTTTLLVFVICLLISVIAGLLGAWLFHSPTKPRAAILHGAGCFAGTLTLCMVVLSTLF